MELLQVINYLTTFSFSMDLLNIYIYTYYFHVEGLKISPKCLNLTPSLGKGLRQKKWNHLQTFSTKILKFLLLYINEAGEYHSHKKERLQAFLTKLRKCHSSKRFPSPYSCRKTHVCRVKYLPIFARQVYNPISITA